MELFDGGDGARIVEHDASIGSDDSKTLLSSHPMDADFWLSNLSRIDFRDFFFIILSTSFILTCHCDLLLEFF